MLKFIGRQLIRPYAEIAKSAKTSGGNIKSNLSAGVNIGKGMVSEMRDGISQLKSESGKAGHHDPRALFEKLYSERNWTPASLAEQRKQVARSQVLFMAFGLFAATVGIWQANSVGQGSIWIPAGCMLMAMIASAAFLARAGVMAWWRCQLDNREIMGFFDFVGRDDFWKNIANPFRFAGVSRS